MAIISTYTALNQIKIGLNFGNGIIPVGRLASRDNNIYFEYDQSFLASNLEISPINLPLASGLKSFKSIPFEGLPGVFYDSLPDGWGRLLLDRLLRSKNLLPNEFTALDRLAHVGLNGMGALVYEPDLSEDNIKATINLDELAKQTETVLEGEAEEKLQELIALNGSSAGARPKALIGIDRDKQKIIHGKPDLSEAYDHWIVKFPNGTDGLDGGAIEFVYSLMAKKAGIEMMETHLFKAAKGAGYFATKRFDHQKNKRLHMHTASGLLHADFRNPSLDYEDLMSLTEVLTKDVREVEKMFRLAVFNVLSHNRDDHGKNFSFLMNQTGEWKLSPAYDLTFSSGPRGHQSTMVMGEGQYPSTDHLLKLGLAAKLSQTIIATIIDQTRNALNQWRSLAAGYGVSKTSIDLIAKRMT
ncbi:MAG: serine/threonine-protein kinase HipA [Cyclobacteriaceae bacterium]|jgi:serine/threonine-protein kinase HipA